MLIHPQFLIRYLLFLCPVLFTFSCHQKTAKEDQRKVDELLIPGAPVWAKNAVLYEVNIRQYTAEGTFAAFQKHLPRLQEMGVDILWLMPVFPISETKRKGSHGNYYAISDYRKINPEFGSIEDLKELIREIHQRDMFVILDWVSSCTGWDHPWIDQHPDFYTQDAQGNIVDLTDPYSQKRLGWEDVADLNYQNPILWDSMISNMMYWIKEQDIDGFRCDMAHLVPIEFWERATQKLYAEKKLFLLADSEDNELRNSGAFLCNYAREFHHVCNSVGKQEAGSYEIQRLLKKGKHEANKGFQIYFTSNHSENSWAGTVFERMGEAYEALAVLACTINGMPLLYGGQEEPLRKRLAFFEKDTITIDSLKYERFYSKLFELKKINEALWHGGFGARAKRLDDGEMTYAFKREKNGDLVLVILNFSHQKQHIHLDQSYDLLVDLFADKIVNVPQIITLEPFGYRVYYKVI